MASDPAIVGPDPTVADILTDAFSGDPFMRWVFGAGGFEGRLIVWFRWLIEHAPEGAEVWMGGDAGAGALWYPPRHAGESGPDEEPEPAREDHADDEGDEGEDTENPFVAMLRPLVGDRVDEVLQMFARGGEMHPPEPHWYLLALGTRTDRQGQGLGARVVRPVLDRCDEQGLGIYLESSNPRNIPFYHRLGFVEIGELWTPDDQAVMTGMWRAPR